MHYQKIKNAIFLKRLNRFTAMVFLDGKMELVHIKNTGRLKELLIKGTKAVLEEAKNVKRKTKYSLIAVYKGRELVNIDSLLPNQIAAEALQAGGILELGLVEKLKREYPYENSRFDLYYEKTDKMTEQIKKGLVEVKGVTLVEESCAIFPDAPTARGKKHIEELSIAHKEGYEATLLFIVQRQDAISFRLNWKTDPIFAEAVLAAKAEGVRILAYNCVVMERGMLWGKKIPVFLNEKQGIE